MDRQELLAHLKINENLIKKNNVKNQPKNYFPSQSIKIFTFRVKLSDSIFFLLGHSPIVKLI